MDKAEFIQRANMIQTESDEFYETYVKTVKANSTIRMDGDIYHLRYGGDDIQIVRKLFLAHCKLWFPDYKIDDSNRKVINYLLDMSVGLASKPGLIIRGNIGTGKTLLAQIYINFVQSVINGDHLCAYYNPIKIMADYISKGFEMFTKNLGNILVIDDVGINTESSHYGNKINVFEHLIYARYEQFKMNPRLQIICTTNLIYKDMVALYGERAISRLNEMSEWNEGALIGSDKRKDNPMKIWPENHYIGSYMMI